MEEIIASTSSLATVDDESASFQNQICLDNLDPDFITQLLTMSQPVFVISPEPDEEQQLASQRVDADQVLELDEFLVQKKSSPKGAKKAHKRVFVNKKKTSRTARRASSGSSSLSDDSVLNSTSTSPQTDKIQKKTASAIPSDEHLKGTTVCRFQCKVCGLTRFLVLRGRLPQRVCECTSAAVFIPCWVRTGSSSSGGGLGRECVHCPRCSRFYSSSSHLRRHKCTKQNRDQQTEAVGLTGVFEMPSCPHCNECFIFDSQLATHKRREHRVEAQ